ncbi:MAG TPA: erythromycin esterase family protein, partial [Nannocystis sp.]
MHRLLVLLALAACAPRLSPATSQTLAAALRPTPETDDPAAPLTDLAGLRDIVGAARIVGLGGPGPGARELTRVHHRVLRLLVEETGFTGLALDADATATLALDAFVRGAAVDLDAALLALADRGLATTEMRALLQYLRTYNAAHGGALRVFGLAPSDPEAAAALALAYLERVDPAYVPKARSLLAGEQQFGVDAVRARLDARRADYLARSDPEAWATARQQVELVAQARRMVETWEFEAGEFARARNAEWALAQLGAGGKLVILADNRRVAKEVPGAAPAMGDFLRQWFNNDYRAIAASVGDGSRLAARDPGTLCGTALPPPRAGS